jgi:hypothetical protein
MYHLSWYTSYSVSRYSLIYLYWLMGWDTWHAIHHISNIFDFSAATFLLWAERFWASWCMYYPQLYQLWRLKYRQCLILTNELGHDTVNFHTINIIFDFSAATFLLWGWEFLTFILNVLPQLVPSYSLKIIAVLDIDLWIIWDTWHTTPYQYFSISQRLLFCYEAESF